ncbi:hypothetical protein Thiowin_03290 [Thiorhodovibrio winogradskyi]|uniref:Uncharacterized protein n=1 Tax=Thiorhodovibrio winogradskyi TaxID=77007 RepID=A0ABZ0SCD5_9GAMM|nr:hypothetical protein [Thiorhodovibrio winogradskyi]
MPNSIEDPAQTTAAIKALSAALQGFEARYQASQRSERRLRIGLFLSTILLLGSLALIARTAATDFFARVAPPRVAQADPVAAKARRDRLLMHLSAQERARLEEFETQIRLIREYVEVSPEFDTGATVALMLSNMNRSIDIMPELHTVVAQMAADMRTMTHQMVSIEQKMNALPVLATDVQGMRDQLGVMAAGVDSTMGRAGRIMPWPW